MRQGGSRYDLLCSLLLRKLLNDRNDQILKMKGDKWKEIYFKSFPMCQAHAWWTTYIISFNPQNKYLRLDI